MMGPTAIMDGAGSVEQETRWLQRIAAGDRQAFELLYDRYQRRLFGYFVRRLDDAGAAAELTNDVLVTVWSQAGRFAGRSKPSSWIFGMAHHKAINAVQRDRWRTMDALEEAAETANGADPHQEAERSDLGNLLRGALRRLSSEHREVVELTFFEGFSYQEIAEVVGCPVNTVKTRMFHAKKRLQPILSGLGLGGSPA